MRHVHVVVPESIDNPARPSGGNVYDRRLCAELGAHGWQVRPHVVAGSWPAPDAAARHAFAAVLAAVPDGRPVVVDGLLASTVPDLLAPHAGRVRLVALVHMPLGVSKDADAMHGRKAECRVLHSCRAVVTTSRWTRDTLLRLYRLAPGRIHVAVPGSDPVAPTCGRRRGNRLLCVASIESHKGHDQLVMALANTVDLPWQLRCVGALDKDPAFVDRVRRLLDRTGVADRVELTGPLAGSDVHRMYDDADILVLASSFESYGMVVTEALAHALPVIATAVGGIPEALGRTADGRVPGVLVPPGDSQELAAAIRHWLTDPASRRLLRQAAASRRTTLPRWSTTAGTVSHVLHQVSA